MVELAPCIHIKAPWLDGGGVALLDVIEVQGVRFFKVKKTDSRIQRLLSGKGTGGARPLTPTSIVEDLIALRNTRRIELMADYARDADVDGAKEELDLDGGDKQPKDMAHLLPEVVHIICPAHGDIAPVTAKVLMQPPHSPLWLELSAISIEYLHRIVVEQTRGDEHITKKARCRSSNIAPYWDETRGAFRVRYQTEPGQTKFKDFRPKASSEGEKSIAMHRAQEFASSSK
jgi:hypothetical protein